MAINQLESNLEAITRTIAQLKKDGCSDEKILNELRENKWLVSLADSQVLRTISHFHVFIEFCEQ